MEQRQQQQQHARFFLLPVSWRFYDLPFLDPPRPIIKNGPVATLQIMGSLFPSLLSKSTRTFARAFHTGIPHGYSTRVFHTGIEFTKKTRAPPVSDMGFLSGTTRNAQKGLLHGDLVRASAKSATASRREHHRSPFVCPSCPAPTGSDTTLSNVTDPKNFARPTIIVSANA
jgi:hypothetical protein